MMVASCEGLGEGLRRAAAAIDAALDEDLAHWYLLVDAAQLPEGACDWRSLVKSGTARNVLADDSHAEHPEVCPLLMRWHGRLADALLLDHLEQRPFAFTVLRSGGDDQTLARGLEARCRVALPGRRRGLLRWYDAAVLHSLASVFSAQQWRYLLAPATHWLHASPSGEVVVRESDRSAVPFPSITEAQLQELGDLAMPHRVLASLVKQGHVSHDAHALASLEQVVWIKAMLNAGGITEEPAIYEAAALLGKTVVGTEEREHLQGIARQHVDDWGRMRTSLIGWIENSNEKEAETP